MHAPRVHEPQFVGHCHAALGMEVVTNCSGSMHRTELSQWQHYLLSLAAHRYEVEINRRTAAENEFVVLKKVRGEQEGLEEA